MSCEENSSCSHRLHLYTRFKPISLKQELLLFVFYLANYMHKPLKGASRPQTQLFMFFVLFFISFV
ncbi:hypothetical protein AXX17_AT1G14070 [Arabidopsis thaliana]|uniref:Uncharacterized protein n=1 Tax=Arabidopsis thaliana TaxID=3702 RepID=A0A178W7Q6_ARATH|nr:hypothetical protein AXX17_AT1G14070 [Arabidopsis thaliana]